MSLELIQGDLTKMKVDAIVNAANSSLSGGGGVDGAIHRAAGPELLAACRKLGGCPVGQARLTAGFQLPSRYVIHTVGPRWQGGTAGEAALLRACYQNSLQLAYSQNCSSVAFPLISSGAYGYPVQDAIAMAIDAIRTFWRESEMQVYLVLFDQETYALAVCYLKTTGAGELR
ncbi:O-acetyl-ADP-ribose deacetylase [Oscillospiraceae bacterium HV4-5-C5C]|nr:O-acetyl-ADP-ribose deacetylase [Oscillospiraceae bacterium HV4-5-C5C]